jgi:PTS system cellobiose-specific IIA component
METVEKEELYLLSMQVILHAGNAKDLVYQASKKAAQGDFEAADTLVVSANQEITKAHKLQTETLQKEAEGIEIPYSPLFMHAQDTLMTTKTEINLIKEIISLRKELKNHDE